MGQPWESGRGAAFNTSGDIAPDPATNTLHVRLDPLSAPRRTAAIAELCRTLNDTNTVYPGTTLTLHYSTKSHRRMWRAGQTVGGRRGVLGGVRMSVMSEHGESSSAAIYQLRVVLRGISPLIWRRLLVPAAITIADLHAVLQVAFGWTGTHLHRFVVHGREPGISYVGGVGFDDPRQVRLGDLGLRRTERFTYHYDFTAGWCHDLRVEQIRATTPYRRLPVCIGGRRAGPPEDCGGVWAFLEWTQPHHVLAATIRAAEILALLLDEEDLARVDIDMHREELTALLPLLGRERFDRRKLNRALATLAATGTRAA